jgi:hypothetical protein
MTRSKSQLLKVVLYFDSENGGRQLLRIVRCQLYNNRAVPEYRGTQSRLFRLEFFLQYYYVTPLV